MISIQTWLGWASQELAGHGETPLLDAQVILAHVTRRTRTWLAAYCETQITPDQLARANEMLERYRDGTPLPYLLGHREFFGLDLFVSPAVLIPRPETELLVEAGLDWLEKHPQQRQVADVGTGSGCIAVSLAHALPDVQVVGLELSPEALAIAQQNVDRLGLGGRVRLRQSDLLDGVDGPVDVVCANLPYIPTATLAELSVAKAEPLLALDGGADGLRLVERLLGQMSSRQLCRGLALLEIETRQGDAAERMALQYFPHAKVSIRQDLGGHDRLLAIQME